MTKIIKAVNFTRTISPQAVMASDFAISRFKYIVRLLLVHGHWNYDRLARMILYFFYKNATFVFAYFWFQVRIQAVISSQGDSSDPMIQFQLYCGFSGAVMIDQMYLMLYNLLFTSLPPVAIGRLCSNNNDQKSWKLAVL